LSGVRRWGENHPRRVGEGGGTAGDYDGDKHQRSKQGTRRRWRDWAIQTSLLRLDGPSSEFPLLTCSATARNDDEYETAENEERDPHPALLQ